MYQNSSKQSKQELNEINEALELKVKEQTSELLKSLDIISKEVIYSKTNLKGVITEVSEAFCKISQYSKEELVGQPHSSIRHIDTDKEIYRLMWNTLSSDKIWHGKVKNRKKDGGYYIVNMSITPQYDKNNIKVGYMAIMHNITDKIELIKLNESLESRIKEEVSKNVAKEMIIFEQSKMANMGAMIGNIAHQWKQPLSTISIAASGLKIKQEMNMLEEEDIPKLMDIIVERTQYLSDTITTFRNFLKEKKELAEVVLQDRIDVALNIVNISLKDNDIELKNNIHYDKPIKATIVAGELTEVIINIINNAKDILVEKKIKTPWVKLELTKETNKIIITIEDNGGGIPLDIMPKIFDEYFTTKTDDNGTGLGLYMSYQIIIKSLKGKLYAKNTKNGAKFFIEL